jgi:hypothetical protein
MTSMAGDRMGLTTPKDFATTESLQIEALSVQYNPEQRSSCMPSWPPSPAGLRVSSEIAGYIRKAR